MMATPLYGFQQLSAVDIQKIMPHRYPFLLIDRVEKVVESKTSPIGDRLIAIKAVTQNEPFFQGHFPGNPVMPGVMILEAMCQAAMFLSYRNIKWVPEEDLFYFTGVEKARFRAPVVPGCLLRFEAVVLKVRQKKFWSFEVKATVSDSQLVSE